MKPTSPAVLYDLMTVALQNARWRPSRPFRLRRYVLWMTEPVIEIRVDVGGVPGTPMQWEARRHDHRGYGFTRRQVEQIRYRLITAMQAESAQLQATILARLNGTGQY